MIIKRETTIDVLVNALPAARMYLSEKGINCAPNGGPVTGTLEEVAKQCGLEKSDVDGLVHDLNRLMDQLDN